MVPFKFSSKTVEIIVSEKKPQLSNQESQVIQMMLLTRKSRQPISDVEAFVTIALPNGKKLAYDLPPTNKDGLTQVTLPPLKDITNEIIPYTVCLNLPATELMCASESFIIWDTR